MQNIISIILHYAFCILHYYIFADVAELADALVSGSSEAIHVGSSPVVRTKKVVSIGYDFFYPSRRLGISSPHEVWWISSALWAVYHHRRCIPLRLDDIQNFVLMICNFCEIDDIQGSRLDFNVRM